MLLHEHNHAGQTVLNLLSGPSTDSLFLDIDHGNDVLLLSIYHTVIIPELTRDAAFGRHVVIGAYRDSRFLGAFHIFRVFAVHYRAALGSFEVDKLHARVLGDALPVDGSLVMRNVDAVIV